MKWRICSKWRSYWNKQKCAGNAVLGNNYTNQTIFFFHVSQNVIAIRISERSQKTFDHEQNGWKQRYLALLLKESERLAEAARELTCLCGKSKNEYKYEYVVENTWKQVAGKFEFVSANKTIFLDILLYDSL